MKILLAEDNAADRRLLKMVFEQHGYQDLLEARDGQEGLEMAEKHRPDIIISDGLMPRMDGFQFLSRLKMHETLRHIPFIFYSATYIGDKESELAKTLGAEAYIEKPMEPAAFWEKLREILKACRDDKCRTVAAGTLEADPENLREYSRIVASKLEEKVLELEQALTERGQAEESLRKSEAKYRAIFENVQDVFYQVGMDGNILDISPSIQRYSGYSRQELIGRPIIDFYFHPEDRTGLLDAMNKNGEVTDFEVRMRAKDNRLVYTSVNAHLLFDDNGRPTGMEGSLRDITERKLMENLIVQAKNEWVETFDIINEAITIHDRDFNIIRANRAAEELLGVPQQNIIRQKCYQSFHCSGCPADGCPGIEALTTGKPAVMEQFEPHLGKFLEVRTIPRFDTEGQIIGLVHVVRDITDRKLSEENQKNLQAQLIQSQKMESIGRLAGGIAHDFNNLLSAIIGYSELLMMKLSGDPKMREQMEIIMTAGEKAAALTHQLLAFSRKQVLRMEAVNLNEVIESMTRMLGRIIGEDIILDIDTNKPVSNVLADKSQLEQILLNLSVNARDAMPAGGSLTIETAGVSIDEEYSRGHEGVAPGQYVMLSVSDTGSGMSREVQDRIFEPFFTTKEMGKGTGLGLATVYGIVRQHNGHIYVYSELGKGTTFKVYLPAVTKSVSKTEDPTPVSHPEGHETILVVDDDATIRSLILDTLQPLGYQVLAASGGHEALRISDAFEGKIDLLLTDVIMPEMNGRELSRAVRSGRPDIKVIFMSGYTDDAIAHHGVLDPGVVLIQKPVTATILAATLREVMEKGQ